jgi:hypothetical protein
VRNGRLNFAYGHYWFYSCPKVLLHAVNLRHGTDQTVILLTIDAGMGMSGSPFKLQNSGMCKEEQCYIFVIRADWMYTIFNNTNNQKNGIITNEFTVMS